MTPQLRDAEDFRALARASLWRWDDVELEVSWSHHPGVWHHVGARRGGTVRVLDPLGRVTEETEPGPAVFGGAASFGWVDGEPANATLSPFGAGELADRSRSEPVLRPDGLVASWAGVPSDRDAPFWNDYHWIAVLGPWELSHDVDLTDLREVVHEGRPAWEAVARPRDGYDPRCSCCALMATAGTDAAEGWEPQPRPSVYRVRLDLGTGICVLVESLDHEVTGAEPYGHEVRVLAAR